MNKNKELHELFGHCWHEDWYPAPYSADSFICKKCKKEFSVPLPANPDYAADPRLVLREMEKRGDWPKFLSGSGLYWYTTRRGGMAFIALEIIMDTTGKLRDIAIEWLKNDQ